MTDEVINGEAVNGERCEVSFPWYSGKAGVQVTDSGIHVAYFSRANVRLPASGIVGGKHVRVLSAERSKVMDTMTVLTVEHLPGED